MWTTPGASSHSGEIETSDLLQQIEKSRKITAEAEKEAIRAREEAYRAREEYQTRVQQIANVQRTVRQEAQEEARKVLRKAEDKAENLIKELTRAGQTLRKGPTAPRPLELPPKRDLRGPRRKQ